MPCEEDCQRDQLVISKGETQLQDTPAGLCTVSGMLQEGQGGADGRGERCQGPQDQEQEDSRQSYVGLHLGNGLIVLNLHL